MQLYKCNKDFNFCNMKSRRTSIFSLSIDPTLGFHVRSTGDFTLYPPDREAIRHVDFGEIFWCIRGKGIFRSSNSEVILKPEYVWYYPPGSVHDYQPYECEFHYCWLAIAGKECSALFDGLGIAPGLNYAGICPQPLFENTAAALPGKDLHGKLRALSAAFEILTLISAGRHSQAPRGGIAEEAQRIVDDHFTDPALNVEEIASMLGVHRGSLSRAFSSGYGVTLNRYMAMRRFNYSQSLLLETDLPIRKVAEMSGFNSHEYFSRIFTEIAGMPPIEFRKNNA